jgi:hypothetical protein
MERYFVILCIHINDYRIRQMVTANVFRLGTVAVLKSKNCLDGKTLLKVQKEMRKCQKFREATKFAFANLQKAAIALSRC